MHALKIIARHLRPYRVRLLLALIGTALFTFFSLLSPLLLRHLFDRVIQPGHWETLQVTALLILLVPLTSGAIRFFNVHLIMLTANRFVSGLRLTMYSKMLTLGPRYHGEHPSGVLVGRLMDDVNMVQRLLTGETIQLLVDIIVFGFAITVLFVLAWKLALILSVTLVLYVVVYKVFAGRIRGASQAYRQLYDEISGRLQETIQGVRQVRIYNREESENALFLSRTESSLEKLLISNMSSTRLSVWCNGIAGYGSTVIAATGAYLVLRGELTYGDLYAVDNYVWMAVNPVIRLTTVVARLAETFVSLGRIAEVLEAAPDIQTPPAAPRLRRGRGAIRFDGVHFGYSPDKPLFTNLSLDIPAGMTVALAGHTGCGKSTLTTLLMRYWDVTGGAITIDGVDIRQVNLQSLRARFGVVPQQQLLFEGTLAENIAYGLPRAPRPRIEEAARLAEVYQLAMDLPNGFDTIIGPAGVQLSVGEKQRVAIARAILRDPMVLIMDEATSALDSESEALIQKALRRIQQGRTSLVIAHRLSTIENADRIVVMDQGRIVEIGTHTELLARDQGLYRGYVMQLRSGGEPAA
ncbi:MAG: ABC transporter ATP-binding protein/permease [Lentisphaerae bacterium]|nr:ABC transporter ATP-binding protein/permease [Lentisphaerota bacterium]